MKKLIIISLILMLLCSAALAETQPELIRIAFDDMTTYRGSVSLPNGSLVIAADTRVDGSGKPYSMNQTRGRLICLAPDGSVLWERRDDSAPFSSVYMLPVSLGGGRLLVGQIVMADDYTLREWVNLVFSDSGELLGEYRAGKGFSVTEPHRDGYVQLTEPVDSRAQLRCVTWDGETRYSRDCPDITIFTAIPQADGAVLAGISRETNQAAASKVADNGDIMWTQVFQFTEASRISHGIAAKDGRLLMVGGLQQGDAARGMAMCLGADGALLWKRTFDKVERLEMIDGALAIDEGYLLLSHYRSDSRLWLGWMNDKGELTDTIVLQTPDTVYSHSDLRLLAGEPVVLSNVNNDSYGSDSILITKVPPCNK